MQTKISESRKLLARTSRSLNKVLESRPKLKQAIGAAVDNSEYLLRSKEVRLPSLLLRFWGIVDRGIVLIRNRKGSLTVGVAERRGRGGSVGSHPWQHPLWKGGARLPETINKDLRRLNRRSEMLKLLECFEDKPTVSAKRKK